MKRREKIKNSEQASHLHRFLDFLFPQHLVCHVCGNESVVNEYGLCPSCADGVERVNSLMEVRGLDGYAAGLYYNEVSRRAMHAFKFGGALYIKEFLTHFISIPEAWAFDWVIPVPLHPSRERKRGYNQSLVLARELCKRYNLKLRGDLLKKARSTPDQVGLSPSERMRNLSAAFVASDECRGRSFLLVDDVRTTGATLLACAKELKKHGAVRVYAVTACLVSTERTIQ